MSSCLKGITTEEHKCPSFFPPDLFRQENRDELEYLRLIYSIISRGNKKDDRTGVGTMSKFGCKLEFDLSENKIPLLTTKKVFFRGVAEELLWFISGSTDANKLSEKGVKIWNKNGCRENLDKLGFKERKVGDLGPVYGFQWRHFGAKYIDCDTDYTGKGYDQLSAVIEKIKTTPNCRRIVLSSWNPSDLNKMVLPPCHIGCQFYVNDNKLSCMMYQRSCDMGLGVPFNIASYALLTHMIAKLCELEADRFIYNMGDTHVYLNHIEPLKEQLKRSTKQFPTISFSNKKFNKIEDFTYEDIIIENYDPHPNIKMEMAL